MESGNFMDKELDKRFIYKKSNKIFEDGGKIPDGFIPKLITKSITTDNITLEPGTYYEYTNPIKSLILLVQDSSMLPSVVWFKTGTIDNPSTPFFLQLWSNGLDLLIPQDFLIGENTHYELSIINKRVSLLSLKELM